MTVHTFTGPGADEPGQDGRPTDLAASPWEALVDAMNRPLPKEINAISPLKRPEVEVRLRTNVGLDELKVWRDGAKDPAEPTGYNMLRMVCILLANASTDIVVNGQSTGTTLADPKIRQMYPESVDEVDAVRHFFGREDLWLTTKVLPALTSAWSGGDEGDGPIRPTAAAPSTS